MAPTVQNRQRVFVSGPLIGHILVSKDGHWAALDSLAEASTILVEVLFCLTWLVKRWLEN